LLFFVNVYKLITSVGLVHASRTGFVIDVAVLAAPLGLTRAVVITHAVNASSVLARIIGTLVSVVLLASFAGGTGRTKTGKFRSIAVVNASSTVVARVAIARAATEIAIGTDESWWA